MKTETIVSAYDNETLAAIIADLSGRRWLDQWSAKRLAALEAEKARRTTVQAPPSREHSSPTVCK